MRHRKLLLIALVLFSLGSTTVTVNADGLYLPLVYSRTSVPPRQWAQVLRVIDGDSIVVSLDCCPCIESFSVRLLGVDTPERGECYYSEATEATRALVDGKRIALERDVSEFDSFGRLLRHVYTESGEWLNGPLVAEGYARVLTVGADRRYAETLLDLQLQAQTDGWGGWADCVW